MAMMPRWTCRAYAKPTQAMPPIDPPMKPKQNIRSPEGSGTSRDFFRFFLRGFFSTGAGSGEGVSAGRLGGFRGSPRGFAGAPYSSSIGATAWLELRVTRAVWLGLPARIGASVAATKGSSHLGQRTVLPRIRGVATRIRDTQWGHK